ncbi:MAG TPA: aminoacyl-tRNA hydrolase [Mizugakiibacter sp.]|nr:aminoacyl-tRNA hydrolase [Mizugakiibacter sp.]
MHGIKLIVGLGNPGAEYLRTRHNIGFWLVDTLARAEGVRFVSERKLHGETCRIRIGGHEVRLLKPMTFMNHSGRAVLATINYWKYDLAECLVVHDDLDLPPGVARLKFDGGHGGQNGLRDIIQQVGDRRFHRLRFGIGHPGRRDQVTPWVLGRPSAEDEGAMLDAVGRALDILPRVLEGAFNAAMQQLHTVEITPGDG